MWQQHRPADQGAGRQRRIGAQRGVVTIFCYACHDAKERQENKVLTTVFSENMTPFTWEK